MDFHGLVHFAGGQVTGVTAFCHPGSAVAPAGSGESASRSWSTHPVDCGSRNNLRHGCSESAELVDYLVDPELSLHGLGEALIKKFEKIVKVSVVCVHKARRSSCRFSMRNPQFNSCVSYSHM